MFLTLMRRSTVQSLPLEIDFHAFFLKTVPLSAIIIFIPILDLVKLMGRTSIKGRRSTVLSLPLR